MPANLPAATSVTTVTAPSSATAPAQLVRARWFDGRSSQAQAVLVGFAPATPHARKPDLLLHPLANRSLTSPPLAAALRIPHHHITWPEAWSAKRLQATVMVDLGPQGSLEVDDVAQWHAAFAASGAAPPLAQRMQTGGLVFATVLLVAGLSLWAFYRFGTPWAATQLTRYIPLSWETDVAARTLEALDANYLKPSSLPAERQAALRERFEALARHITPPLQRYPGYAPPLNLAFRSGMGANAFALPGGTLVMTDALVKLASAPGLGDDALLGVLAHEIGHVTHRHTTRMVVEQGVLNVGLGLALGDVSTLASTGATLLTGLAYRRQHETEADCFAVALMHKAGVHTAPMADLLLAISQSTQAPKEASPKPDSTASGTAAALASLLSSHPATAERAERLKQGKTEGCQQPD